VAVHAIDGRVTAVVDASDLPVDRSSLGPDDVLNGIAHDPDTDHFLLTGKRWPSLFEVELVEAAGDG
jgi:glutamine cyclotransferase